MKRPTVELTVALVAAILALAALVAVLVLPRTAAPTPSAADAPAPTPSAVDTPAPVQSQNQTPQDAYRLEKLNQVSDMALARQVVPEDYLRYLDEAVAEKVEAYNSALCNAKIGAIQYAKGWAESIRNDKDRSPEDDEYDAAFADYGKYLDEGDNYFRFIEEFSTALLYPNHTDFTVFGTVVGYPAGSEMGGSGGLWAGGFYLEDWQKGALEELAAAVDDLLNQCDAARQNWEDEIR